MKQPKTIMLAGGGTGGHLFPGIALAQEFRRRFPEVMIVFVGTRKGLESRVIPPLGYRLAFMNISGMVGKGLREKLRVMGGLPAALIQALVFIVRYKPDLVIGLGGYASAPMLVAARLAAIPLVIQEQNAFPGVVNRLLAPLAATVFVAFEEARKHLYSRKIINCGNPVRLDFATQTETGRRGRHELTMLVVGGSQGAHSLNTAVPEALVRLQAVGVVLKVIHQTGSRDYAQVQAAYQANGIEAEVAEFFPDMAPQYAAADLVVSRAGALTLAELALVGRPAILVPYPHAAHDHQDFNARVFMARGAALMIRDHELNGESLAEMLQPLLQDRSRLQSMQAAAAALGCPRAVGEIVDRCLGILSLTTGEVSEAREDAP
ncbi:MAG: undecaprenyldiphospho-muramoylpentapeptide beta-N-acetylglucosaminyltransferase [Deltaproteobacteria bacterium]|nr:undecaprenyldiphospho-muramoylpentapeptide beta-N-acetylglucosaminyltransferase [Candidatus Anaeroferrophillus wilburensis]MBN2888979.1 undecaprenyldiphospho-muramoylpentapeptide beta-N-acetylglucosaminyltransferase [Deltaproteobacteria bacterium]